MGALPAGSGDRKQGMRLARIGRANAKNLQNLHTPNPAHRHPQGEEKFLVTRQCADRTRPPVQAAQTYPTLDRCQPVQKLLRPPGGELS